MKWPENLEPTASEPLELPDGRPVLVPKTSPGFPSWRGPSPGDNYNGKPILDFNGRPAFAELAILWSFQETGWEGAWVDSYRNRYLRGFWPLPLPQELPAEQKGLLREIASRTDGAGRPWDVFCWSSKGVVFAEAKRLKRDSIRLTQIAFLAAALEVGVPLSAFLLVEWTVA
jgi:hypothetical protein